MESTTKIIIILSFIALCAILIGICLWVLNRIDQGSYKFESKWWKAYRKEQKQNEKRKTSTMNVS